MMTYNPSPDTEFWLVWCPTGPYGGHPTHRHETEPHARNEARRLACRNPGQRFFVLQAVAAIEKPPEIIETTLLPSDDGVPF
jgi:hypothetical protein